MGFFDGLVDTISGWVSSVGQMVYDFFWSIIYYIAIGICYIVGIFGELVDVFAGLAKVQYDGEEDYLLNIFFSNSSVSNVYWAIALLGMLFCIAFTLVAVIRKTFDIGDKVRQSLGQILASAVKGILMIFLTTVMMVGVIDICSIVMEQIDYLFTNAEVLDVPETITYTDEQYATMARTLNTIGNYAVNPSYNSRYNINSCYNAIRKDMKKLQDENVFRVYYETKDSSGQVIETWQSVLQRIANTATLSEDMKMDQYNEQLAAAMIDVMDILRNGTDFKPVDTYKRPYVAGGEKISMDRIIFLMGTMNAAKNAEYNINPGMADPLRGPYYAGAKSIYDLKQVKQDFDIGTSMNYLVIFLAAIKLLLDLGTIMFNCIASIFNVVILYLVSPMIFATIPLDDGAKVKQWSIAYIVQSLGLFANIFAMRLMIILIPIIMGDSLILFDNSILNIVAKVVLLIGLFATTKKATGMITGILSDQAGFQSVQAGDMSDLAKGAGVAAWSAVKTAGAFALGTAGLPISGMKNLFSGSSSSGEGSDDGNADSGQGGGSSPSNESGGGESEAASTQEDGSVPSNEGASAAVSMQEREGSTPSNESVGSQSEAASMQGGGSTPSGESGGSQSETASMQGQGSVPSGGGRSAKSEVVIVQEGGKSGASESKGSSNGTASAQGARGNNPAKETNKSSSEAAATKNSDGEQEKGKASSSREVNAEGLDTLTEAESVYHVESNVGTSSAEAQSVASGESREEPSKQPPPGI